MTSQDDKREMSMTDKKWCLETHDKYKRVDGSESDGIDNQADRGGRLHQVKSKIIWRTNQ